MQRSCRCAFEGLLGAFLPTGLSQFLAAMNPSSFTASESRVSELAAWRVAANHLKTSGYIWIKVQGQKPHLLLTVFVQRAPHMKVLRMRANVASIDGFCRRPQYRSH